MGYVNMKKFNKDKYLRKLRFKKYKRYLYIGIPCILVLLVGIYFAYSKFSVSKEEEVVRTTVGEFIHGDVVIGAYIDGEYSKTIPGKNDGYTVDKIVCDNDASASWDNDSWGIVLTNLTKRTKCNVYFKKYTLVDKITDLAKTDTVNLASDDPDNNVRYIGKNPSNYVYFNCSDYNNQSDSTCEKWRIIGAFNNVTKSDGTKENLVKIIRNDSLGSYSWDYKASGVGTSVQNLENNNQNKNTVSFLKLRVLDTQNNNNYNLKKLAIPEVTKAAGSNDWTDSQLMMMLNPINYLKSSYINKNDVILDNNGQEIYRRMGAYYNGTKGCKPASIASGASFSCTEVDFTSTGLKNDTTRNAIEEVVWNLGGAVSPDGALTSNFFRYERGSYVYNRRPIIWTGKIGLMYPSDYGYATSGGTSKDRSACQGRELFFWDMEGFSDCMDNDYLYDSNWTMTPCADDANTMLNISVGGTADLTDVYISYAVRPTLFLKSSISMSKGTGTQNDPYRLKIS